MTVANRDSRVRDSAHGGKEESGARRRLTEGGQGGGSGSSEGEEEEGPAEGEEDGGEAEEGSAEEVGPARVEEWIAGLIGGVVALIGKGVVNLAVQRWWIRGLLARDLLVDVAAFLVSVEGTLREIDGAAQPAAFEDLLGYPSHWRQPGLVTARERYISGFSAVVHRHAIVLFDALDRFEHQAKEHRAAFDWLLQACSPEREPPARWDGHEAKERRNVIADARSKMQREARRMLAEGHGLFVALHEVAESPIDIPRGESDWKGFLSERYGLSLREAQARGLKHARALAAPKD